ncbi:hypothetical protein JS528_05855 [Bifidobacterium sp. MA2]|uniref:DUF559 domain-containing protein n=1 Tax=Bifidobacterium santillanense TaxID=2809028 RepID=A0ABS5UPP0_9BIFI|nr:hypothetical protein [Bifidobacterium santillanense]
MREGIVADRRMERERCNAAARRTHAPLHIGYLNAVRYWGAPVPRDCSLDASSVHAVVSEAGMRRRVKGVVFHVFRGAEEYRKESYESFWVSSPAMTWAQMAPHCGVEDLAAIGAAMLSRDTRRKVATLDELKGYVDASARFIGRKKCLAALPYIVENTDSPPETQLFGALADTGVGRPTPNYRVEMGDSYVLLDMAYPDCKVAFEYQGYYHGGPDQMLSDAARLNRLQARGWVIVYVTADNFRTVEARRTFMVMARTIVMRQRYLAAFCRTWLGAENGSR